MKDRIHLVVREDEKERYRRSAQRAGVSLSEWLREAAREKMASDTPERLIDTVEELRAFFAECDARHEGEGAEPDWEDHKKVIAASVRSGLAGADEA
ncbi:MAG: plasmid mobilization protein [Gemmatimonadota bacterium]